jgi:hypothetical protein
MQSSSSFAATAGPKPRTWVTFAPAVSDPIKPIVDLGAAE